MVLSINILNVILVSDAIVISGHELSAYIIVKEYTEQHFSESDGIVISGHELSAYVIVREHADHHSSAYAIVK